MSYGSFEDCGAGSRTERETTRLAHELMTLGRTVESHRSAADHRSDELQQRVARLEEQVQDRAVGMGRDIETVKDSVEILEARVREVARSAARHISRLQLRIENLERRLTDAERP